MSAPTTVGRYEIHGEIAAGGTATLHVGRLRGEAGFARTVAIKRLHPSYARDPEFGAMFLDEARLSARIRHPNVVPVLDVTANGGELLLVMELVDGESLSRLSRGARVPLPIASAVVIDALRGLHAAHEATDESGQPLLLVHRDVSPHNLLVGVDGVARVVDFGIAKAVSRAQTTREGTVKGKLSYMAPEQLASVVGAPDGLAVVDRRTDVYAAGIILWELATGERLFVADDEGALLAKVANPRVTPPALLEPEAAAIEPVVMKALAKSPDARFATAAEMADALELAVPPARREEVARWVRERAGPALDERRRVVAAAEGREPFTRAHDPEAPTALEATARRPTAPWTVVAVVGLVSLAAGIGLSIAARTAGQPNTASVPRPSATPSLAPPIPSSAPSPSTVSSAPPSATPTPSITASIKRPPTPAPSTSIKKPNCDPPFVIDAQGKKIFRVECL